VARQAAHGPVAPRRRRELWAPSGPFRRRARLTPLPQPPPTRPLAGYGSLSDPVLQRLAAARAFATLPLADAPAAAVPVPPSFLGLSLDLNDIEGVAHPDYLRLVKRLTAYDTGPM
jgi:hypothetical protein